MVLKARIKFKFAKLNQNEEIAGRKISEILSRFDKKIRDPRSFAEGKKTAKIIKEFLKISCPLGQMEKYLNNFFKKNVLTEIFSGSMIIENSKSK